mgnify:CR=1 FL=1
MTRNDDGATVVLLNSVSQYLKDYERSVENWIDVAVEDQRQHVLNTVKDEFNEAPRPTLEGHPVIL